MIWAIVLIIILLVVIILLSIKIYMNNHEHNEVKECIYFQLLLLREIARLNEEKSNDIEHKKINLTRLQSFWPRGRVGYLMYRRHEYMKKYIEHPEKQEQIKEEVKKIDHELSKHASMDMNKLSENTYKMLDEISDKKYFDSLVSTKTIMYNFVG